MKTSEIVKHMCLEELNSADIKAICKARGFHLKEASDPEFLENFLLSDQGINESISKLSKDEVIMLHMLAKEPGEVDVSFFDCIYGPEQRSYWNNNTFNKKYSDVFKKVKNSLIRRGILFFAENKGAFNKKTKLERTIFKFHDEFTEYLPPILTDILSSSSPGNHRKSVLREKIMEIIGIYGSKVPIEIAGEFKLRLVDNELYIGKNRFKECHLLEWQKRCWTHALKKEHKLDSDMEAFSVVSVVSSILSKLKPGEWTGEKELEPALNIFCYDYRSKVPYNSKTKEKKLYDAKLICDLGWRWGCIAKNTIENQTCYSLSNIPGDDIPFGNCMHPDEKYTLIINLETIPFRLLERLNCMFDLKIVDSQLTAAPNTIRLGRMFGTPSQEPLTKWLMENVPAFNNTMTNIKSCWGRHIVHEDLLMAKVKDLSLKMTIKKSFSDTRKLFFLPNDFIAFPKSILGELDTLIGKSGFAIKMVESK